MAAMHPRSLEDVLGDNLSRPIKRYGNLSLFSPFHVGLLPAWVHLGLHISGR